MDLVPLDRALVRPEAGELPIRTQVVVPSGAEEAGRAGDEGFDGDAVARAEGRDGAAAAQDDARGLVPEGVGAADKEVADAAGVPEVHVRTADAGCLDVEEDVVAGEGGGGDG